MRATYYGMMTEVDDCLGRVFARSSQAIGEVNTLPLELEGLTTTVTRPDIYALGTVTSAVSFAVIFLALLGIRLLQKRTARAGSDAGSGMV